MLNIKAFFKYSAAIFFVTILLTLLLVLPLRWYNPLTTSFILQDDQVSSALISERWASYNNIAPVMSMAVIASEDQKFPYHHGFDFDEIQKAINEPGGPRRGASTITQQLAKNLYLWSGRNIFRKGVEAYFTLWLEGLLPKERILELYLNTVEFGPGIYGVTSAAEQFFYTTPNKLNRVQASLMATALPNPKKMDIGNPSPYMFERAIDIRFFIDRLGGVSYLKKLDKNVP